MKKVIRKTHLGITTTKFYTGLDSLYMPQETCTYSDQQTLNFKLVVIADMVHLHMWSGFVNSWYNEKRNMLR